jgi:hypothetical protein
VRAGLERPALQGEGECVARRRFEQDNQGGRRRRDIEDAAFEQAALDLEAALGAAAVSRAIGAHC